MPQATAPEATVPEATNLQVLALITQCDVYREAPAQISNLTLIVALNITLTLALTDCLSPWSSPLSHGVPLSQTARHHP